MCVLLFKKSQSCALLETLLIFCDSYFSLLTCVTFMWVGSCVLQLFFLCFPPVSPYGGVRSDRATFFEKREQLKAGLEESQVPDCWMFWSCYLQFGLSFKPLWKVGRAVLCSRGRQKVHGGNLMRFLGDLQEIYLKDEIEHCPAPPCSCELKKVWVKTYYAGNENKSLGRSCT